VIQTAREAGIKVGMITGDHPATAAAIAREIGLMGSPELVLEGSQFPEDEQVLGALLDRDGIVVSRVSPEQKLRVAKALQNRGHVVAMTGDGVNDGLALQEPTSGWPWDSAELTLPVKLPTWCSWTTTSPRPS
jgi:magnesium-transporting ATPase (P-type)